MTKISRKKVEPKIYSVWAKFNGVEVRRHTNDLDETLVALKPEWLHTEVFLKVKKGDTTAERYLGLVQAKQMFANQFNREVFINNLLLS
jgi:hypothetical protein